MTTFLKSPTGDISIAPDFKGSELNTVPSGYWRIACSPEGYYLTPVKPFELPEKIYGSLLKHVPRIKEVFAVKTSGMTVMLEGLKGSGKSLLMKYLAKDFVDNEDGIVLINEGYSGAEFFSFLQDITQKKIVITDEFDKKYRDTEARNSVLSLLDGTYPAHTMYILTMNASTRNDSFEFFHNRPGRVFFNLKFEAVDKEAIEAYFQDHLTDQNKLADVMAFIKRFRAFNMDMLGTLAAEINACPNLSLDDISTYLNIKPDIRLEDLVLSAKVKFDGKDVTNMLYATYLNDGQLQNFLKCVQNPGRDASLNLMASIDVRINSAGKELTAYTQEVDVIPAYVVKTPKANNYIEHFDVYFGSKDATVTRNEEGNYILTAIMELPQIFDDAKKYYDYVKDVKQSTTYVETKVEIEISTATRMYQRFDW